MEIIRTTDHEVIAALNKDIHEVHASLYPAYFTVYDYTSVKSFFKEISNKPAHIFLLAREGASNLGYAWAEIWEFPETPFRKLHRSICIHHLSIVKAHSNKGIGSQLLHKIEEMAKENGIQKLELDYWADNKAAGAFYRKHRYNDIRIFMYKDL